MGNAFERTFSQAKESDVKAIDNITTKQHNNKSISTINTDNLDSDKLERKTLYLKPEIAEMFKYVKFKKKIGESKFANMALERYIENEFGKNWRTLIIE